jgi:queuosine precursor transporter
MKILGVLAAAAFLACVALSNYAVATYAPWQVAGLVITAGTWFAAATFILRDVVQVAFGRWSTYGLIVGALVLDYAWSRHDGDLAWVTTGSVIAFACSETIDSEVFTRWRLDVLRRILASGIGASVVDSFVFVLIALSPLTTGLLGWGDVTRAIAGQIVAKLVVCTVGSAVSARVLPRQAVAAA